MKFSFQISNFKFQMVILLLAAPALAVSTSHWTQNSEADFKAGTLHNVVVTNLNDVKLSRAIHTLLDENPKVGMVTALAEGKGGVIYAGTAPRGVLLQVSGDKVTEVTTIEDAVSITALKAEPDGGLLIGVSGAKGRILKIDKPGAKPRELFSPKDVQYVWGLVELSDGIIYAATGPNGQLFAIYPDGHQEEIYKSDDNNLTALVSDGKDLLYVGTDPNGLVVRINRKTKNAFVMYNADEEDITALTLDPQGNLYAATGQAAGEQPATPPADNQKETAGRPEPKDQSPLPSQPPNPPKPPPAPGPNPGEPPPIPQKPRAAWPDSPKINAMPVMLVTSVDDPESPGNQPDQPSNPGDAGDSNNQSDASNANKDVAAKSAPAEVDQTKPQGNAIYKIDPNGFVTEIFREDVVIYSMAQDNGVLLVGTGDDGEIYQVDPAAQEVVVVAKTDAKEVASMLIASDGQVYLGLSNTGSIATMTGGYADSGTYVSPALDATQVSRFGVMQMHGSLPKATTLTLATREGNLKDAEAKGWSKWSDEASAQEFLRIGQPPARFLQYRITFKTTDPQQTPVIKDVDISYQLPHLAPVIRSIKIADAPQPPAPQAGTPPKPADIKPVGTGLQTVAWDASSPDDDALVFSLYFRIGGGPWILLKDKLTDPTYNWDTKTVADGRYEVKVIASDAAANEVGDGKTASRVSDALVVDNTPPVIGDMKVSIVGRTARIDLRVTDRTSTVASMEYSLDSADVWQTVLPVDKIFDEPEETVDLSVDGLAPGAHQITLRATDAHGNVAYQTVSVTVSGN
jgi:hypothetical protein